MATESTTRELKMVMAIALPLVFLILLLTTTSWFEPVLFMATIGVAIVLNMGTNLAFGTISFCDECSGQRAAARRSMDYSIFCCTAFPVSGERDGCTGCHVSRGKGQLFFRDLQRTHHRDRFLPL